MIAIADYYFNNEDELNENLAIEYYIKASLQNNISITLINYYLNTKNYENLEYYYTKFIEYNSKQIYNETHSKILNALGLFYSNVDTSSAIKYYKTSINYGDTKSMYDIAILYKSINEFELYVKFYEMALNNNYYDAIENIHEYKHIKELLEKSLKNPLKNNENKLKYNNNHLKLNKVDFENNSNQFVHSNYFNNDNLFKPTKIDV